MYNLNIHSAIKMMTIKEIKTLFFKKIQFTKEKSYYSMKYRKENDLLLPITKLIEKIPDASNNKEYYQ